MGIKTFLNLLDFFPFEYPIRETVMKRKGEKESEGGFLVRPVDAI